MRVDVAREHVRFVECKICKDVPSPPVVLLMCCNQILGCSTCFYSCMEQGTACPLCREPNALTLTVRGLDDLYTFLKEESRSPAAVDN